MARPSVVVLETERLRLRTMTENDGPHLRALNARAEVFRFTGDGPLVDDAHAIDILLTRIFPQHDEHGVGRWAVERRDDGAFLGWCGLRFEPEGPRYDLGYRFLVAEWGKGYATEAARASLAWGRARFPDAEIIARVHPENAASRRVLVKLGLVLIGTEREDFGEVLVYAAPRGEFLLAPGSGRDPFAVASTTRDPAMTEEERDGRVEELERELNVLRGILADAPGFLVRVTPDLRFRFMSRLAPGITQDELESTSVMDHIAAPDRDLVRAAIARAVATREGQWYSTMGTVAAGKLGYYFTRVNPVVEDGRVTSLVLLALESTEIQEDRAVLKLALEASGMGVWTFDPAANVGTWDEATQRIFGVSPETQPPDLPALLAERIHPDDRALVEANLRRALETGVYDAVAHRLVLPDGRIRWVNATGVGIRGADGNVTRIVGAVCDITERRALEARLVESERLESIGRLAGGIAHDFNNMLTTILGNVALARTMLAADSPIGPLLDEVELASERSAALTDQLLAFARRTRVAPETIELASIVRRVEPLIRRALGEHIDVAIEIGTSAAVVADPTQLEQIVMNLVVNARDAMPDGGRVTITVVETEVEAGAVPELAAGPHVELAVTDTGRGIAPDVLPHIFEPFYTTKVSGTGLGLATCYGIARQAGGALLVESGASGSTFRAVFPRSAVPTRDDGARPSTSSPAPSPRVARVLVVEDEPLVRSVIERALRRAGHVVESVSDPMVALARVVDGAVVDVVVTDVVMPALGGPALVTKLRAVRPGLPVLFVTGYAEGDLMHDDASEARTAVLEKPFVPDALVRAVADLLDDEGA